MIAMLVSECITSRMIHKALLKGYDIDAMAVSEGEDAIDLFKLGMKFDLVMIDEHLCPVDGIQVTTILRSMGVKDLIVGVTDDTVLSDRELFLDAGADLVFDMPMNAEKAALIVQAVVENK